eukprot:TRINITY_DN6040_c0_g1_i1.p1 TRINITY_DN6040_c0_g1~~TRINITY_DN6040_c0_g1_i1.p1  ORF type:complete len:237 (+),score=89.00 TRINITY_DN6040_c0_g1_i1:940-1650(+)
MSEDATKVEEKKETHFVFFSGVPNSEVKKGKRAGWFPIDSHQFGMGRGIWNNEVSDPSISEITISKIPTVDSPRLLFHCLTGTKMDSVVIESVREPFNEVFFQQILSNVYISGFSTSQSQIDAMESISLNFDQSKFTTNKVDDYVETLSRRKAIAEKFTKEQFTGHLGTNFEGLPNEQLHIILSMLPKKDLLSASSVCKRFFKAAADPRLHRIKQHSVQMYITGKPAHFTESEITK